MSSESNINRVLVISCDEETPENVIKNILNVDEIPEAPVEISSFKGYEWNIKTKYYSTTATLFPIQEKRDFESDFAEHIQATIFFFNGKKPASFENVLSWMPLLECVSSEVQLLVCENCSYDESHKKNVLNWCIENEFELIELEVKEEGDVEDGDILPKCDGYRRVIEALQTCSWPSLVLKSDCQQNNTIKDENETECEAACSDNKSDVKDASKKVKVDNDEILLEEQWLQKVMEQDDPGEESFEALFAKFASMKEKASNLNGEDRKKYAEKVAIAFCKAMGCEEEIEGLDGD